MNLLWQLLNTPAGVTVLATIALWLLNRIYQAKPAWRQFEGTIIAAIKHAEKVIPDDSDNASVERLNNALQYVITVYGEMKGRPPSPKISAQLREAIQVKHAELEASGALTTGEAHDET